MVKLGNPKNVFWEALLLTGVVFFFGLLLGVALESNRLSEVNEYYMKSEIALTDILALNSLVDVGNANCEVLISSNLEFADRIYEEAVILERYEEADLITDDIKLAHKKYDLLRTFLWINGVRAVDRCGGNFSVVVYLYEYDPEDLTKKATQNVWSKILFDLKQKRGEDVILIPIAADDELVSLSALINRFNVSDFPVVIVNDEKIIRELTSVEDLEKFLE